MPMAATATIAPRRVAGPQVRGRLTVLVAPGVDPCRLAQALAGRWGPLRPASVHVVAVDSSVPLWSAWADAELCLFGGVWDLYEECWQGQDLSRARRLADLAAALADLGVAATYETFVGALANAVRQAPGRWPGPIVVARRHRWPAPHWLASRTTRRGRAALAVTHARCNPSPTAARCWPGTRRSSTGSTPIPTSTWRCTWATERLAAIRRVFIPRAGVTLGRYPMRVRSQAKLGVPENVSFEREDVAFAALHVVGSNNGLVPWTGKTAPTPEQQAEVDARTAAAVKLIGETFRRARNEDERGVVLMLQADMFDPTIPNPVPAQWTGLAPIVQAIAREAARFDGPVLLVNGDSHGFVQDQPLAAGSPWLALYGLTAPVPNLTRVTVEGSDLVDEWVKLTVHDDDVKGPVFDLERVPFAP